MHTDSQPLAATLVMAASTRTGSVNVALARRIAGHLGPDAELIELRDHPMPVYDGDLEARDGVPASARALAERMASAEALIIVTPEYNGAFTPLLKNTIDWVTRIDIAALAHLRVLVATASPGQGGGAKAATITRAWLANMGVDVAEHTLCVSGVSLADDGDIVEFDDSELERFVIQAVRLPTVA
jgi:NAD(P)H-dependent FMN reductase